MKNIESLGIVSNVSGSGGSCCTFHRQAYLATTLLQIGYDHFFPYSLIFAIYGHPYIRHCITPAGEKALLNNLKLSHLCLII